MIVDCHTHLNYYSDENQAALPKTLDTLKLEMKRNRIDFALTLTSYKELPGRPTTKEVVEATRDIPYIYVIAGVSYYIHDQKYLDEIREYIQSGKVRGLKFYCGYEPFFPNDEKMRPAVELAEEFDIPLLIHCGDTFSPKGKLKFSHPLHVDELAVDHPKLKIVICHLGNPWIRDCMEVVYKNKNVYTDISGLVLGDFSDRFERYMVKQLQEMLLYGVEPDRVLYGTDFPISSMSSYLEFIRQLKLPQDDLKKILSENSMQLFKLKASDSPLSGGRGY
ncbi:MAG: amidohydrolase [Bradymonadales bacterium]|nr:MAG: amidohydrolase [Bradymonadales bacterium]